MYQNPSGRGGPPPRPQGGYQSSAAELPKPQPVSYFENGNKLRAALVDTEAEDWAGQFRDVSTSQLRRFYEHVITLRRRLDECPDEKRLNEFELLRPEFKMLKAKAAYTVGRETKRLPLLQFFVNHTNAVKTVHDFSAFVRHFEAVIAFHKYFKDKSSR
jgi:CRISPR-associated protein Csm2